MLGPRNTSLSKNYVAHSYVRLLQTAVRVIG